MATKNSKSATTGKRQATDKKKKFSKQIVVGVITLNVLFVIAILAVFWHTGNEPSTLIGGWFAFTTGELWSLSKIKRSENNEEN